MPIALKNLPSPELAAALAPLGASPRLARRLQAAALKLNAFPDSLPEVSPRLLSRIRHSVRFPSLDRLDVRVSPRDGFAKYIFRGDGPEPFESVRIPLLHRPGHEKFVVCVSSQVGCPLACAHCATGKMGFLRNLAAWEIVDQVLQIAADSPHPVGGVVFMGMGEPMLNLDEALRAARILSEPCGLAISAKAISVSTAGVVPGILRFAAEKLPFRLVVSLSCADPRKRALLMPVERSHPLPELVRALRVWHSATRRRIVLAWTMVSGFNVGEIDALQIADLFRGLPLSIDLIDVNDPSGRFLPPSPAELDSFRDALRRHLRMPVVRRYSGGADVHAACGMLGHAPDSP